MRVFRAVVLSALFVGVACPGWAGNMSHGPHAATFVQAGTNCAKTQLPDGGTPKAPVDVICCEGTQEFWLETPVPPNADGANWVPTIKWVMDTADTTKGCLTISNFVCKDNQDCQDVTPGNAVTIDLDGVGTANRLETDVGSAFAIRNVVGAADCTGGNCALDRLFVKYQFGTAGGCTQNLSSDKVCILQVDYSYDETP